MIKKLMLIKLSNAHLYKERNLTVLEPLGLEYIAAAAGDKCETKIIDLDFISDIKEQIKKYNPDMIGTTVSTPMIKEAKTLTAVVKNINKNITVVLGGAHPTALPQESLEFTGADVAVLGEGENTIKELINETTLDDIKGIVFKKDREYKNTGARTYIDNIDSIDFPTRYKANRNNYQLSYSFDRNDTLQNCASVITSRSCPYQCIYCASKSIFGKKLRVRSVDNIISELEHIVNDLNIKSVIFLDDCFTIYEKRTIELCKKIIQKNLNFSWWIDTRVDKITENMIKYMKAAGCKFIVFGVESGNQEIINQSNKNLKIQTVIDTFKLAKKHGIDVKANFMIGHYKETEKQIKDTIHLAKILDATRYGFYLTLPLPGSPLYQIALDEKLITKDFKDFKWYGEPVSNISTVSHERLLELQKLAYDTVNNKETK